MESKVEVESEGRYNGSKERTLGENTQKNIWKFQRVFFGVLKIYIYIYVCVCVFSTCVCWMFVVEKPTQNPEKCGCFWAKHVVC